MVIRPEALGLASGSGICFTFFPAAFFAHYPSAGLGLPCFLQILWSATSEIANSFAKCVIGLDRRQEYSEIALLQEAMLSLHLRGEYLFSSIDFGSFFCLSQI